ncbi:hypothetical protein ZIOFF_035785 [Zingiber officinale]|uniref:60S acidic ribosomal protein P2 n=1 Tax=Zingiber officinale TaxID=94328 RepID=A0A8J5L7C6_ZINOF|nr:hypothetical protein ZIOFF_035785 [Zingiber officinale]
MGVVRGRDQGPLEEGQGVAQNSRLGRGCRSGLRLRRSRVPWFQGQDQLSPSRRRCCSTHLILRTHHREVRDLATAASSSANLEAKMKIVVAYLLAVLSGNPNPSADDIRSILESGAEAEDKRINHFLAEVKGKDITEVIAAGREKFASVPSGGSVAAIGVAAPGSGGAGGAPAAEEPKKEEKVEEKEESDEVKLPVFPSRKFSFPT